MQDVEHSNAARVAWSFAYTVARDIFFFRVAIKKDGVEGEIFNKNVAAVDRSVILGNLLPRMGYIVTVEAVYRDGIKKKKHVKYNDLSELMISP